MDHSTLRELNPWWENKELINNDINLVRLGKQKIKWQYQLIEELNQGIYSLRGPRQVGKTTWIKQKIKNLLETNDAKNIFFYSCDNIRKFEELTEIIELFLELADKDKKKYIFLDEIPYVEDWQRSIKHLYDSGKLDKCAVVLSGSHSIDIKRSVEQLPGRGDEGKKHFIMLPLTFSQYLEAIGKKIKLTNNFEKDIVILKLNSKILDREYKNYLLTGGFLKMIDELSTTGKISDSSYDVYLKWIIGDLAKWDLKENIAKQIIRRIIESYTSELSWSSVRSGTDIDSHHTASKYVNAIEEMFIFNLIYKMDFNKKIPDFPKSKKIYFSDPLISAVCYKWAYGIENAFQIYQKYLDENIDKLSEGVLLNHLINMVYKKIKSNVYDYKNIIYYWKNKNKTKEIDFICHDIAFELKYQEEIKNSDYKALEEFEESFLITKKTFDKKTFPLPAFLILLESYDTKFLR